MKKFIVAKYFCEPKEIEEDMNKFFEEGYYPKEIKMDNNQQYVEATIIYERVE